MLAITTDVAGRQWRGLGEGCLFFLSLCLSYTISSLSQHFCSALFFLSFAIIIATVIILQSLQETQTSMAVFLTFSTLLCLLLLLAGAALLTVSVEPEPTVNPRAVALFMTPQTRNIIDTLIGTNDFGNWAIVVNGIEVPSPFPLSTTFFIPTDRALSRPNFQSYIVD